MVQNTSELMPSNCTIANRLSYFDVLDTFVLSATKFCYNKDEALQLLTNTCSKFAMLFKHLFGNIWISSCFIISKTQFRIPKPGKMEHFPCKMTGIRPYCQNTAFCWKLLYLLRIFQCTLKEKFKHHKHT